MCNLICKHCLFHLSQLQFCCLRWKLMLNDGGYGDGQNGGYGGGLNGGNGGGLNGVYDGGNYI